MPSSTTAPEATATKKAATKRTTKKKAPTKKAPGEEKKETRKKKALVWGSENDPCKEILKFDLVSGAVPATMKPKDVYLTRPEYKKYHKYENFRNNLNSLRKLLVLKKDRMLNDCAFYGHDRLLLEQYRANIHGNPHKPYPNWHSHAAKNLLKEDVAAGAHIGINPSYLWIQRPEYLDFPLEVFRQHIYQVLHENESRSFRFEKKGTRKDFNLRMDSEQDNLVAKNYK